MKKIISPLASVFIFFTGNSLVFTILIISMNNVKASTYEIGALTSAYFAGLALGSFNLGKVIVRIGHIRAYAGFAATIIIINLMHSLFVIPSVWILLRFLASFAIGGLFLVVESWLISKCSLDTFFVSGYF